MLCEEERRKRFQSKADKASSRRIGFSATVAAKTSPRRNSFTSSLRTLLDHPPRRTAIDRTCKKAPTLFKLFYFFLSISKPLTYTHPTTMMPTRNPTGFDINEFKAAASPRSVYAKRDPWARKYVLPLPSPPALPT